MDKFQITHGNKGSGHCDVEPFNSPGGLMYCFFVPSGMLVLCRNNRVFIMGNSGKDSSKEDRLWHIHGEKGCKGRCSCRLR